MCSADKACFVLIQRVLHCITDRLTEIVVYYRMEMSVENTIVTRILKLSSAMQFMVDQKPPKNVEYLKKFE